MSTIETPAHLLNLDFAAAYAGKTVLVTGGAGAIVSEKLQKSAERAAANGTAGKSGSKPKDHPMDQPGTGGKVATAKHQPALAIANAAVRGGSRPAAGSPSSRATGKAARTSQ